MELEKILQTIDISDEIKSKLLNAVENIKKNSSNDYIKRYQQSEKYKAYKKEYGKRHYEEIRDCHFCECGKFLTGSKYDNAKHLKTKSHLKIMDKINHLNKQT